MASPVSSACLLTRALPAARCRSLLDVITTSRRTLKRKLSNFCDSRRLADGSVVSSNPLTQRSIRSLRTTQHDGSSTLSTAGATVGKIKRFYKEVTVQRATSNPELFEVCLDGRTLKTPLKHPMTVPSKPLAYMIAHEWDVQDRHIERERMHLSSLCNTAIDNPSGESLENRVDQLLEYLVTDTVCFRSESPEDLYNWQLQSWDPLVEWFSTQYNVELPVTTQLSSDVPSGTIDVARDYCLSLHPWEFTGLDYAVRTAKSFIIGDALVRGHLSPEQASSAARLEVLFQISRFGEVEWHHTIDEADTTARLAAASLFTRNVQA
eukprot:m.109967 g.109967  ORF g.109967 m.109967 type:complete len:322 (+) comp16965_c0_seq1:104-1069(+)